jgi:hypothetical protein
MRERLGAVGIVGDRDQMEWSSGCSESRQRAVQPVGMTATVMRRPHSGQKRGGSSARLQPGHSVVDLPQPVQWFAVVMETVTG